MFDFGNSRASEGVSLYFKLISKEKQNYPELDGNEGVFIRMKYCEK